MALSTAPFFFFFIPYNHYGFIGFTRELPAFCQAAKTKDRMNLMLELAELACTSLGGKVTLRLYLICYNFFKHISTRTDPLTT